MAMYSIHRTLNFALQVVTPIGSTMVDHVAKGVKIVIEGKTFLFDMILLDMGYFDVILGMDWLQHVGAMIDCQAWKIVVRHPAGADFVIRGRNNQAAPRLVTTMKA